MRGSINKCSPRGERRGRTTIYFIFVSSRGAHNSLADCVLERVSLLRRATGVWPVHSLYPLSPLTPAVYIIDIYFHPDPCVWRICGRRLPECEPTPVVVGLGDGVLFTPLLGNSQQMGTSQVHVVSSVHLACFWCERFVWLLCRYLAQIACSVSTLRCANCVCVCDEDVSRAAKWTRQTIFEWEWMRSANAPAHWRQGRRSRSTAPVLRLDSDEHHTQHWIRIYATCFIDVRIETARNLDRTACF